MWIVGKCYRNRWFVVPYGQNNWHRYSISERCELKFWSTTLEIVEMRQPKEKWLNEINMISLLHSLYCHLIMVGLMKNSFSFDCRHVWFAARGDNVFAISNVLLYYSVFPFFTKCYTNSFYYKLNPPTNIL